MVCCFFACSNSGKEPAKVTSSEKTKDEHSVKIKEDGKMKKETFVLSEDPSNILYQLDKAANKMTLDGALSEISALSFYAAKNELLTVNDENGILYFLDATTGAIKEALDFAKDGDFEGVELVGNTVYICKSNGHLYPYDLIKREKGKKIKTVLGPDNDVEGLTYNPVTNSLLLACKGSPNLKEKKFRKTKAFYQFDLVENKIITEPFFILEDIMLKAFFDANLPKEVSKSKKKKLKNRLEDFSPSAIAIHPVTKDYYILSSVGRLMIVVRPDFNTKAVYFLNDKEQTQPEGICFSPEGNLFISNEGRGLAGFIYQFKMK